MLFLAMQQYCCMRHIVEVGGRTDGGVHQSRVNIHADVCIDAEVPLVALLGPVHLGVSLTLIVLGRAKRRDDGGIHNSAGPEHQALLGQTGVDGGQYLGSQLMPLQ